jgi:hypothetical protein
MQHAIKSILMAMRVQETALDIQTVIMVLYICLTPMVSLGAPTASLAVTARVVSLDPADPVHTHIGALTYLWGYELSAADTRFGGWSGLALDPTGKRLYAISDHGFALSARLYHDAEGRFIYIDTWTLVPLLTPTGQIVRKGQRDAEALGRDRDGAFLVAFEHDHRVWRYPPSPVAFALPPQPVQVPSELAQAPLNGGIEAMTVLADGSLLLLTEQFKNPDGSCKGWLLGEDEIAAVSYMPTDGYVPTDLATLGNGDLLLLERRYHPLHGAAVRIQRIDHTSIQGGARLQGKEIAQLKRPLLVDNFEGLAVHESATTGTLLYLISDDNYNFFQRTLLFQFRLESTRE